MGKMFVTASCGTLLASSLLLGVASVSTATQTPPPAATVADLVRTASVHEQTVERVNTLQEVAVQRRADAVKADKIADVYAGRTVRYLTEERNRIGQLFSAVSDASTPDEVVERVYVSTQIRDAHLGYLVDAERAHERSVTLEAAAVEAEAAAVEAAERAQMLLKQMSKQAEKLGLGKSVLSPTLPATREQQQQWNREATQRWRTYLDTVDSLNVVVPSARDVDTFAALTAPLTGLFGEQPAVVLPQETVRMVGAVLRRIGSPYTTKIRSKSFMCNRLLFNIDGGYDLHGTLSGLYARTVEVSAATRQIGDLVFLANKASGIHHVGMYVGDNKMVDATGLRYTVGVSQVPDKVFAYTRPALGLGRNVAPKGSKKPTHLCNTPRAVSDGWAWPMGKGTYRFSAAFGQAGRMWSSGFHTGQDFGAPAGTPVYASRGGVVSLTETGWAGTLITVTGNNKMSETYAHTSRQFVKEGQRVKTGDKIAAVGSRGNTTGPHLHFEIHRAGTPVDPIPLLLKSPTAVSNLPAWGGYGNGLIPDPVLCDGPTGGVLRCDAATVLNHVAHIAPNGVTVNVARGYEPLSQQIDVADGRLTGVPGTSLYGWGTRIDVKNPSKWLTKTLMKTWWEQVDANTWVWQP